MYNDPESTRMHVSRVSNLPRIDGRGTYPTAIVVAVRGTRATGLQGWTNDILHMGLSNRTLTVAEPNPLYGRTP